ncbi:MAG: adenylosuccinate lyase [Candidatus Brocadiia bacterium]
MDKKIYQSPLVTRYCDEKMVYNFSDEHRLITWRRVWVALAEAERALGLPVSKAQIAQLKRFQSRINYDKIAQYEKLTKHEVVGHIKAYGEQCPKAKPIIHLGATSALVTDNADLIIYKQAIDFIRQQLKDLIRELSRFALRYKDMPTCGYTHLQPALLTTVGKRACLWLQDLVMDYQDLVHMQKGLKFLGAKGAIGTQASFLALFNGNANKVQQLDKLLARKLGFNDTFIIASQTYTRKQDYQVLAVLSGLAQSAHKFSTDLRLLQSFGEMEEPFSKDQVGSSAMAYKRNPVHSERITALSRYLISLLSNAEFTHASQWLERSLDDSANRRLTMPESFLTANAILNLYIYIVKGMSVNPSGIQKRINQELPFMVTEDILMAAVKAGGDRQQLHKSIRDHSMAAVARIRRGEDNDLIDRIRNDPAFLKITHRLDALTKPERHTGLSARQVEMFTKEANRIINSKH